MGGAPRNADAVPISPDESTTLGIISAGILRAAEQWLVPVDGRRIDERGDRGVGGIGDVQRVGAGRAARERPGHPAVHRPEAQLPLLGPRPLGVDLVEDGHDLGGRRVGSQADPLGLEHEAGPDGSEVLPADPRCDRSPGGAFPHDARGALVGDTHAGHHPTLRERRAAPP